MLSKQDQAEFRNNIFRHLDGIVTGPSAYALMENSATEYLLSNKRIDLSTMAKKFNANEGYLNVALWVLCSQGWLVQHLDNNENGVSYEINNLSEIAFSHFDVYQDTVQLLQISEKYHVRKFEMQPFLKLESTFKKYKNNFGIELSPEEKVRAVQQQILTHIEGMIVTPTLVYLGMVGMFHKYFRETCFRPEEFHKDANAFGRLLDIFADLGWFRKINNAYQFTEQGLFFTQRASAYGVTVSYIPTLRKLDDLVFGDPPRP